MKVDKVIFACDDNAMYKDFWKLSATVCKAKLDVTPVLFHITNEDSDFFEDEYGLVKKIKRVDNINTGFQSQLVRMWGCSLLPNDVCLTSDIDMLMINKDYFITSVEQYDNDAFVIYTSDAYGGDKSRFPICYNASLGINYKNILGCENNFSDYCRRLQTFSSGWSCDEQYFTNRIKMANYSKMIYLNRGWDVQTIATRRIDRVRWGYDSNIINDYIDCHCIRPYNENKAELDKLIEIILK